MQTMVLATVNQNVHSVEMQIHADSKGKVALDDITLYEPGVLNYKGSSSWVRRQS